MLCGSVFIAYCGDSTPYVPARDDPQNHRFAQTTDPVAA